MNSVTTELGVLLDMVATMTEDIDSNIADRKNDFRSMCFYNIYNRAVFTREIVVLLERSTRPFLEEQDQTHERERVMIATRGLFIDSLSSIEKAAKDCISAYKMEDIKEKSMTDSGYLYLRYILYASAEKGFVDSDQIKQWDDLMLMRNLVIHNNSESDRLNMFEMDDIKISMRPGRMMKGPTTTFVKFTEKAVELFYDWLKRVDEAYGK